jgi:tetratricopeptide (TPR) repeat protein
MTKKRRENISFENCSLPELCGFVKEYEVPFEDVADFIEDRIYAECSDENCIESIKELLGLSSFFENMFDKNEENCRDLADVYIMTGELYQYIHKFQESIAWFRKAAIVSERYALPYHSLAIAYRETGDRANAIKCLEQEIKLEPGNYFSVLVLVDLYEQSGDFDKAEDCLRMILERNPDNMRALHKLISYYETRHPELDVEFMRRRLLAVNRNFNELEIAIRTYHLCMEKRYADALSFLSEHNQHASMQNLLKAHVYGELKQFSKKKKELTEFRVNCLGKVKFMENKIDEFDQIFGKKAVASIEKILMISHVH